VLSGAPTNLHGESPTRRICPHKSTCAEAASKFALLNVSIVQRPWNYKNLFYTVPPPLLTKLCISDETYKLIC
jgi:hypothetical protein